MAESPLGAGIGRVVSVPSLAPAPRLILVGAALVRLPGRSAEPEIAAGEAQDIPGGIAAGSAVHRHQYRALPHARLEVPCRRVRNAEADQSAEHTSRRGPE